ncbi:amino acid transporter [Philodulcilactobacillus myokoensis]|uniref:Amino acid transporter n=1 Tax=Philodulcilactobacillus myokoensis TaxID=2929573 RepID=A0A9W6B267_9LACO|nr:APC family permease [Philodulcilactobacillus myokoensis]GLB47569.1 amino acid transporter [Philodulcilactobacillus myokoensis]
MQKDNKKLSLIEVIAFGIAAVAPTGAMAFSTSASAKLAGINVPLSFLLGAVGMFCVALCFASMAKYVSDAGSVYAYNRKALGERAGFITGWILAFAYIFLIASMPGLTAHFLDVFLNYFGINLSINVMSFVIIALIWAISIFGIKVISKVAFFSEIIAVAILIVLACIIFTKGGSGGLSAKPFIPQHNISGIGQGMIYAVLSFAGFEGISAISVRTKNPKKAVPKSIIAAIILITIFFIGITFAEVSGFGIKNVAQFANSQTPLDFLAKTYIGNDMAIVIDFAILLSGLASFLGTLNACSYLFYGLAKQHYLPKMLGKFDFKLNAPKNAVNVSALLCALLYLLVGIPFGYETIYSTGSTLGVLGLIIVYMMVCYGNIFFYKNHQNLHFSIVNHLIVPVIGILVLFFPFLSNVYPIPPFPANLYPYMIILWVVVGFVISFKHDRKAKK